MSDSLTFVEVAVAVRERTKLWEKEPCSLDYRGMEFGGEAGEALNKVKKISRLMQGMPGAAIDLPTGIAEAEEEFADTIITLTLLANELGIDLGRAVRNKFNATSDKHNFPVIL